MKFAIRKSIKSTQKNGKDSPDTVVHVFDILRYQTQVGTVTVNTTTGVYGGVLYNHKLPDFSNYAAWKSGQPLASLEAFTKSTEGLKWLDKAGVVDD